MSRNRGLDSIFAAFGAHPYLWMLAACLCCQPFLFGTDPNAASYALSAEAIVAVGLTAFFGVYTFQSESPIHSKILTLGLCGALAGTFLARERTRAYHAAGWSFVVPWVVIAAVLLMLAVACARNRPAATKAEQRRINCLTIIALGFLLRLCYVVVTSVYTRQHDVASFGGPSGHAGYIEYLLYNGSLPDFDPRTYWQFYQPPLHHAIGALWIFFSENVMLVDYNAARESLQTLTLFYSMCIVITVYRILQYFKLKGWALYLPLTIISLNPGFMILSGSINNDQLSVVFVVAAILCTLKWYEKQTTKGIIKVALCVGLGMMSKMSAATIAPSVALVFLIALYKRVKSKGNWKELLIQFFWFCVVCIPLGTWFGTRNYVNWGVPFTYVQELDPTTNMYQYVGSLSFLSRLTDFSWQQFTTPYVNFKPYDIGVSEYNPLVALLKTSVFGEFHVLDASNPIFGAASYTVAGILFWANVVVAGFAFVAMIVVCFSKSNVYRTAALFLVSFYVVMIVSYCKTAADYPHSCTMNFRYISPVAIVGAVFLGLFLKNITRRKTMGAKVLTSCIAIVTFIFAVMSEVVYAAIQPGIA